MNIPYSTHTLGNGLDVLLHEDRSCPIVAVNIWYHVGSKNEVPGRTGFAHLFEHLMYQGSEHFNDDFFKATRQVGATNQNGSTSNDRTNYYQTVPKEAIDTVLWLESDRMGHFLPALTEARLTEQRGVVQNEKRQGDNQPYGMSEYVLAAGTVPEGHPYSWSVIGSMEDLDAASLEDVKEWFRSSYGAANATLPGLSARRWKLGNSGWRSRPLRRPSSLTVAPGPLPLVAGRPVRARRRVEVEVVWSAACWAQRARGGQPPRRCASRLPGRAV